MDDNFNGLETLCIDCNSFTQLDSLVPDQYLTASIIPIIISHPLSNAHIFSCNALLDTGCLSRINYGSKQLFAWLESVSKQQSTIINNYREKRGASVNNNLGNMNTSEICTPLGCR